MGGILTLCVASGALAIEHPASPVDRVNCVGAEVLETLSEDSAVMDPANRLADTLPIVSLARTVFARSRASQRTHSQIEIPELLPVLKSMKRDLRSKLRKDRKDPTLTPSHKNFIARVMEDINQTIKSGNVTNLKALDLAFDYSNATENTDFLLKSPIHKEYADILSKTNVPYKERIDALKRLSPYVTFLPTRRSLTLRDFNDISALPVYFIGLTKKFLEADGEWMSPSQFSDHDRRHAIVILESLFGHYFRTYSKITYDHQESILTFRDGFDRGEYYAFIERNEGVRQLIFAALDRNADPGLHRGFNALWFYFTHEVPTRDEPFSLERFKREFLSQKDQIAAGSPPKFLKLAYLSQDGATPSMMASEMKDAIAFMSNLANGDVH